MKLRIALLSVLVVSGCAVGPRYERPTPVVPSAFASSTLASVSSVSRNDISEPDWRWWTTLSDETLNDLIDDAVIHNQDLAVARSRILEARAGRRTAQSVFLPQLNSRASAQSLRISENGRNVPSELARLVDLEDDLFEVGFDAAWEIDVFGGVRQSVTSADARVGQAIEAERALLVSVIAEVARNYVELRGAQRRLAIAEKNIRIQQDTQTLVANRRKTGLAPEIDVTRVEAQLAATRSTVPPLRAAARAAAHRIAVLTGQPPHTLLAILLNSKPLPSPGDIVPVGLPSELVWRRPDVRLAERALAAATADIGVATAELYPKFFLTGAYGQENRSFSELFDALSRTWSFGPLIDWPVFRGGAIRANIRAANARQQAAYATFQQSVLLALEDVETQLVTYAEEELRRKALIAATTSSNRTVTLANVLYDKGLDDFLTVLDAERTLTALEDQLVVSETAVVVRLIALYKSLGGGWQAFPSAESVLALESPEE